MPIVFVETNIEIKDSETLAQEISRMVANVLKKPEKYVTVSIRKAITMTRGGIPTDFVYIGVRSIGGYNLTVNDTLSRQLGELFVKYGVEETKIDINFTDIAPENWGKATGTFGNKNPK